MSGLDKMKARILEEAQTLRRRSSQGAGQMRKQPCRLRRKQARLRLLRFWTCQARCADYACG